MAFYYYAYSGHKSGLDRVKRAAALIKALGEEGIDLQLLVNDFRAGLAAREFGVRDAVTIETLLDVDAVAERGDSVILDTPESLDSRLEQYSEMYHPLFVVLEDCTTPSRYGETIFRPLCRAEACIPLQLIDSDYFEILPKEDRTLFFFGDADYEKEILSHAENLKGLGLELLPGYYFFIDYEEELAAVFEKIHDPEAYMDLLRTSRRVVTASIQTALEARAAEAEVLYMKKGDESACLRAQLESLDINIIDRFDKKYLIDRIGNRVESVGKMENLMQVITASIKNRLYL